MLQPDKLQAVDALIGAGKLDAAVAAYRALTGTALIGAKMYVYDRAATLGAGISQANPVPAYAPRAPAPAPTPMPRPLPASSNAPPQKRKGASLFSILIVLGIIGSIGTQAVKTHGFGLFTIVKAPYYRELVNAIVHQRAFTRRLGSPIVVDDAAVWCSSLSEDNVVDTTSCTLPVRGPRGVGNVQSDTTVRAHRLVANLVLETNGTEFKAYASESR